MNYILLSLQLLLVYLNELNISLLLDQSDEECTGHQSIFEMCKLLEGQRIGNGYLRITST